MASNQLQSIAKTIPATEMGDFPFIDWLTIEYKKKAEQSGHWTDYLKVFVGKTCQTSI